MTGESTGAAQAPGLHPVAAIASRCIVPTADGFVEDEAAFEELRCELERLEESVMLRHAVRSVVAVAMTVQEDFGLEDSAMRILGVAESMAPALRRHHGEPDHGERRARAARFMDCPAPGTSGANEAPIDGISLSSLYAPRVLTGR